MSAGDTGVLIFILCVWSLLGLSLSLRMEATPNPWNPLLDTEIEISCIADGPDASSKDVIAINVARPEGKPIAIAETKHGFKMGSEASPNIKGEGHIDSGNGRSFVKITISQPGSEDMGVYQCSMYYRDLSFQFKNERASINITKDDGDIDTSLLLRKFADLEKVVNQQATQISQMADDNKKQINEIDALKLSVEVQKTDIKDLKASSNKQKSELTINMAKKESELTQLQSELAGLKTTVQELDKKLGSIKDNGNTGGKDTQRIAFSMRYNSKDNQIHKKGQTMIFHDIILNQGKAYSNKDGVFTAPVRGVYVFHLVIGTYGVVNGELWIELHHNGMEKADVYSKDTTAWDQSSLTTILELQAGDKMFPYVYRVTGDDVAWSYGSVFSGFLLYQL